MSASASTRKSVTDLTVDDLDTFPIWEYATDEEGNDGQDETWVRPLPVARIPSDAFSLSVATDFECPNGTQLEGIMDVTTAVDYPIASAVLFVRGKYTYVGGVPGSWQRRRIAEELGLDEADVFPLKYTLRIMVEGESEYRSGIVE
jgi:hypothetical protein